MTFRLDGRKALVTGASRGIGRAIAVAYAAVNADVAISARDEAKLAEVAAEIEAHGRKAVIVPPMSWMEKRSGLQLTRLHWRWMVSTSS